MERKMMKVKEWFVDKTQETAKRYNMWIDVDSRNELGMIVADENGYVKVMAQEVISETEKAVQVILSTGFVDGSAKGWKTWIPKSVIG